MVCSDTSWAVSDDDIRSSDIQKVKLTATNESEYFINGNQNDDIQDLKIKVSDKGVLLIDGCKKIKADILSSH
ncbi:MAG: hypothetical protein ACI86M_001041 [Saprospiraceae bacterium]|jgi:hypothetical protein